MTRRELIAHKLLAVTEALSLPRAQLLLDDGHFIAIFAQLASCMENVLCELDDIDRDLQALKDKQ